MGATVEHMGSHTIRIRTLLNVHVPYTHTTSRILITVQLTVRSKVRTTVTTFVLRRRDPALLLLYMRTCIGGVRSYHSDWDISCTVRE